MRWIDDARYHEMNLNSGEVVMLNQRLGSVPWMLRIMEPLDFGRESSAEQDGGEKVHSEIM